jgi:hypothetical protein
MIAMGLVPIFALGILSAVPALAQSQQQVQSSPSDEYAGPTILSRDKSLIGERGGKLIDFRYYGEITGIYDSGLTPVVTDANGNLSQVGANYGVEANFGVVGSRHWRRDQLSVDYRGSYRHYTNNSFFDGTDQFLNLRYAHVLSRRFTLDFKETVGTTSLSNGGFTFLPLTNTDLFAVPANELFDNRTNFLQSRVDLGWRKSARLSFSYGGEGFVVRRRSLALAGLNGYRAHADASYRLTRRQTVTLTYAHSYYDFQRTFGNSSLDSGAVGYSIGVGRVWDFALQGGIIHVNTLGLQQVAVDPAVAAIVGRSFATVQSDTHTFAPLAEARLTRRFSRSSASLNFSKTVTPGNGVYLTSRQTSATADYSYVGFRRFTMGASGGYSSLGATGQTLGKYDNVQVGGGFTYKMVHDTHLVFRYDFRHYTTQNTLFQKDSHRLSMGFGFSPGERPLPLW